MSQINSDMTSNEEDVNSDTTSDEEEKDENPPQTSLPKRQKLGTIDPSATPSEAKMEVNLHEWNCPVCSQLPTAEIYLCSKGHSICKSCTLKKPACPECRVVCERVRNWYAEKILDSVTHVCGWKYLGCEETGISRAQVMNHFMQCPYNPEAVKCSMYLSEECNFQICDVDKHQTDQLIVMWEHLISVHGLEVSKFNTWDQFFELENLNDGVYQPGLHSLSVNWDHSEEPHVVLFLDAYIVDTDIGGHQRVARFFVRLSPETHENSKNDRIIVKISIKGSSRYSLNVKDSKAVPDLTWQVKPLSVSDFKTYLQMSKDGRSLTHYGNSVAQLKKYYANEHGTVTFEHQIRRK